MQENSLQRNCCKGTSRITDKSIFQTFVLLPATEYNTLIPLINLLRNIWKSWLIISKCMVGNGLDKGSGEPERKSTAVRKSEGERPSSAETKDPKVMDNSCLTKWPLKGSEDYWSRKMKHALINNNNQYDSGTFHYNQTLVFIAAISSLTESVRKGRSVSFKDSFAMIIRTVSLILTN